MRKVSIEKVVPGARVAKSVFTADGRVLLTSGSEIKKHFVDKFYTNGITEIFIEDDLSKGIKISDAVCEDTRREAKQLMKNLVDKYEFSSTFNIKQIKEVVEKIIDELLAGPDIIVNLSTIRSVDDYTFEHSVSVCILSLITGIGMGYDISRLKELGVGAILHDIGKLRVPEEILKKPSQLTVEEFDEIKKHTIYGYEFLKGNENISMISSFIAFGHHERVDGSGYPLRLRGDNIHQCAKIVAVADVYDALTSDRVYRKRLHSHQVIEYITSLCSHFFDQDVVRHFTEFIALYPVGSGVKLNTGETGLVLDVNKSIPTRPVVRILFDDKGKRLPHFKDIDLSKRFNFYILEACEF